MFVGRHGLDTFDESIFKYLDMGKMNFSCSQCSALMFKDEKYEGRLFGNPPTASFSLCCSNGAVRLPPIKDPPKILQNILSGNTKMDCDFCQNIRTYNNSLAFASMYMTGNEYVFKNCGPYCFRLNGQIYHRISQLQPENGKPPCFPQIYIYDQQNELDHCLLPYEKLDWSILKKLQEMIRG